MPSPRCLSAALLAPLFMLLPGNVVRGESPALLELEAPLEQLKPLRQRSAAAQDRLRAAAHFATGRSLLGRGDLAGALQHYQRAWHWDPQASAPLAEIVPLAFSLEMPDVAVRYALLAAEHQLSDPLLLRRLALYVTEEGDWQRAVRLYRTWLAHPDVKLSRDQLDKLLVQVELGRLEYLAGNNKAASQVLGNFQQAVDRAGPNSTIAKQLRRALGDDLNATWELCGLAHLAARSFDLADDALARVELPLDQADRLGYERAQAAFGQGNPMAAWDHLRGFLKRGDLSAGTKPFTLLSEVLATLNQRETLLVELAKLQAENPDNTALALALAGELQQRGEDGQAMQLYHRVLAETPPSNELTVAALKRLIPLLAERGDAHRLYEVLRQAGQRQESLAELGDQFRQVDEQAGLTDRLLNVARATEARTKAESVAMAELLISVGRFDEARSFYRQAIELAPREAADLTLAWGLALFVSDAHEAAAEIFQQGVDQQLLAEDDPTFHFYLAVALELSGKTEQALVAARHAAALRPESAEFAARVAWILQHAGRDAEAIDANRALIDKFRDQRDPATREVVRNARFMLSHLEGAAGNQAAAEEWLQQVLDEYPEDVAAMNDLGYLWADGGKYLHRAQAMLKHAVATQPKNAAYRDSLGWVLFRSQQHEAARDHLEQAVALSQQENEDGAADAVILDHLGDVYLHLGEMDEAIDAWQQAAENLSDQDAELANAVRKKLAEHRDD